MRKVMLTLLLITLLPFTGAAKDWSSLYRDVLNNNVVKLEGEKVFCTAFKVEKELFLTANHCLEDANDSRLFDQFGITYIFETVKQDENLDLALLHAKVPTKAPMKFAESISAHEDVLAVGFVYIFEQAILPRSIQAHVIGQSAGGFVGIDTSYKPGFSGGPLVNAKGEVVGLNDRNDARFDVGLAISTPALLYFLHEE